MSWIHVDAAWSLCPFRTSVYSSMSLDRNGWELFVCDQSQRFPKHMATQSNVHLLPTLTSCFKHNMVFLEGHRNEGSIAMRWTRLDWVAAEGSHWRSNQLSWIGRRRFWCSRDSMATKLKDCQCYIFFIVPIWPRDLFFFARWQNWRFAAGSVKEAWLICPAIICNV